MIKRFILRAYHGGEHGGSKGNDRKTMKVQIMTAWPVGVKVMMIIR